MEPTMTPRAKTLLKQWYLMTREANFKTCYPAIATRWERCGLAWQQVGVGFELSRATSPKEMRDWEEAGHQFNKLPELQQALLIGHHVHGWTISDLARAAELPRYVVRGHVRVGGRLYQHLCSEAGLIDDEGDQMGAYLSGMKAIANYFGVHPRTVRRWVLIDHLPVKKLESGAIVCNKDELDLWWMSVGIKAHTEKHL